MKRRSLLSPAIGLLSLAACAKEIAPPRYAAGRGADSITVTSPAFGPNGRIPIDHTCDGAEQLPELVLSSPPTGTASLVLLVEDPDADGGVFTHMILFDVSPEIHKVSIGADLAALGPNARFGLNDFNATHYSGPCPPKGEPHRYRYRVVAVDRRLDLPDGATKEQVYGAMDGHVLAQGQLAGQYAR